MKIILTGATGYVGEGVMLELLRTPQVEKVLSVGRRSVQINRYDSLTAEEKSKLEEYIVPDMMALKAGDPHFEGYDAVYFLPEFRLSEQPKMSIVASRTTSPRTLPISCRTKEK
jgi:uncharacterized protein YbjT (DUF2867 family)